MLFLNRIQAVCRAHEVHRSERWAVRCSEVTSSHSSSIRVTRPRPHRKQAEKVVRGAFSHYKYKKWHLKWICNFNLYSIQFQFYLYSAKTIILSRGALQSPDPLSASTMSRKNSLLVRKEPYAEPRNIRGGGRSAWGRPGGDRKGMGGRCEGEKEKNREKKKRKRER